MSTVVYVTRSPTESVDDIWVYGFACIVCLQIFKPKRVIFLISSTTISSWGCIESWLKR